MRQDMAFFDASRTGELVSRLYSDVAVVQKAITSNITSALRAAGMALGSTAMMFYTCPKLALVSLLVLPMGGALAVFIGRFIKHKQREVQDTLAQSAQQAEECLANIRLVRAFGREATEVRHIYTSMTHPHTHTHTHTVTVTHKHNTHTRTYTRTHTHKQGATRRWCWR
jgi:ATP-binding cassette subfamily B (MDR/TAP) protein 10